MLLLNISFLVYCIHGIVKRWKKICLYVNHIDVSIHGFTLGIPFWLYLFRIYGIINEHHPCCNFAVSALLVILKPIVSALSRFGANYILLLLCLLNGVVLYFGMQYYPDTYTIGYLLFPSSVIVFMLGTIFSVKKVDGSQA